MNLRKVGIAILAAALVMGSVSSSRAAPAPTPVVAASTAVGAGPWIVGGFIGVVAVLCIYDFMLKVNGAKNWDGTPKKAAR